MSRFIMSALLCTFAFAQTAHAIAPVNVASLNRGELARLKAMDPNDDKTLAGMLFKDKNKGNCPLTGHSGDRHANTHRPREQVASASGGVGERDSIR